MAFNPHESSAPNYYDAVSKMSPSELLDQRRAMRARIQDQNGKLFSSEAPYFITSFDRLKDGLRMDYLNERIDNIELPERQMLEQFVAPPTRKIPTRGGRR